MDTIDPTPNLVESQLFFKKRSTKKSAIRKRPATPPPAGDLSSDYSSDEGHRSIKRQRKSVLITATSLAETSKLPAKDLEPTKFTADRSGQIESTNDATRQSNWYDEQTDSNSKTTNPTNLKTLLGTTRALPSQTAAPEPVPNDGTYKGTSNYATFIAKNPNAPTRQVGPLKAPTNIRTITVTDFAPDVCKDYKQTGFCGFGDSCKFLHAREDYKQGWELDKDWEIGAKGKKTRASGRKQHVGNDETDNQDDDDKALEGIPFACILCKRPYAHPIVTKCGHYFCESCALQRYRKTPACAACGAGTSGVFNSAKGLKKLLERKRERARRRREKAIAEGEEVEEVEEDEEEGGGESGGREREE